MKKYYLILFLNFYLNSSYGANLEDQFNQQLNQNKFAVSEESYARALIKDIVRMVWLQGDVWNCTGVTSSGETVQNSLGFYRGSIIKDSSFVLHLALAPVINSLSGYYSIVNNGYNFQLSDAEGQLNTITGVMFYKTFGNGKVSKYNCVQPNRNINVIVPSGYYIDKFGFKRPDWDKSWKKYPEQEYDDDGRQVKDVPKGYYVDRYGNLRPDWDKGDEEKNNATPAKIPSLEVKPEIDVKKDFALIKFLLERTRNFIAPQYCSKYRTVKTQCSSAGNFLTCMKINLPNIPVSSEETSTLTMEYLQSTCY